MASSWKKITDKADSTSSDAAFASDWEAMNAKIEAHPGLNTSKKRGAIWWRAGLAVVALAFMGLGFWQFSPQQALEPKAAENIETPVQPVMKAPPNEVKAQGGEPIQPKEEVVAGRIADKPFYKNGSAQFFQPKDALENEKKVARPEVAAVKAGSEKDQLNEGRSVQSSGANSKLENTATKGTLGNGENLPANEVNIPEDQTVVEPAANDKTGDASVVLTNVGKAWVSEEKFKEEKLALAYRGLNPALGEIAEANTAITENPDEDLPLKAPGKAEGGGNLLKNGFRVTALNVGAGYLTDFTNNFYGLGAGVDVDVQKKGLLLNSGLHYYQLNSFNELKNTVLKEVIDTSYISRVVSTVETRLDSTWIIDTAYSGHYAYSTTIITHYDTLMETQVDSTKITLTTRENQKVQLSYVELPILAGHRFRFNRFAVDVMGGVVLNQLTQSTPEGTGMEKTFGLDAVLQPAVRYYFQPEWSIFGRAALRYGVVANEHRPQKFYSGFQLGLSYHW